MTFLRKLFACLIYTSVVITLSIKDSYSQEVTVKSTFYPASFPLGPFTNDIDGILPKHIQKNKYRGFGSDFSILHYPIKSFGYGIKAGYFLSYTAPALNDNGLFYYTAVSNPSEYCFSCPHYSYGLTATYWQNIPVAATFGYRYIYKKFHLTIMPVVGVNFTVSPEVTIYESLEDTTYVPPRPNSYFQKNLYSIPKQTFTSVVTPNFVYGLDVGLEYRIYKGLTAGFAFSYTGTPNKKYRISEGVDVFYEKSIQLINLGVFLSYSFDVKKKTST